VDVLLRTSTTDLEELRAFSLGEAMDLGSDRRCGARAPLPDFLRRTNALDTLGQDAAESSCRS
jgi:hypothetical protein